MTRILCTCFWQKIFFGHQPLLCTTCFNFNYQEGKEEEKEKGREEKQNETRSKWKNGGRLAEREGKAGDKGRQGGGRRWVASQIL